MGDIFAKCEGKQVKLMQPPPLYVNKIVAVLRQVARDSGGGSMNRKRAAILGLLQACRPPEGRYLVRTLARALRVGANLTMVLAGLGRAAWLHEHAEQVKAARQAAPIDEGAGDGNKARGKGKRTRQKKKKKNVVPCEEVQVLGALV